MRSRNHDRHRQHVLGLLLIVITVAALAAVLIIVNANGPSADDGEGKHAPVVLEESSREDIGIKTTVVWDGQSYRRRPNQELVLLIGYDSEENDTARPFQGARADFLMLVVLDHNARSVSLLQIDREGCADIIDVKCSPLMMGPYLQQPGILPGYHMNKDHWLTILLDGTAEEEIIKELLEISYEMTKGKRNGTGNKDS